VLAGFGELGPYPDAAPAVRAAVEAGTQVFTLTNGAPATTKAFLRRSGLDRHVERVLSIDDVRVWEPAPAPYRLAIERASVPADRIALVAVHSWDIYGAHAAGMTTGWCSRLETIPTRCSAQPTCGPRPCRT
jgi:2-haloacid dehalogenase